MEVDQAKHPQQCLISSVAIAETANRPIRITVAKTVWNDRNTERDTFTIDPERTASKTAPERAASIGNH